MKVFRVVSEYVKAGTADEIITKTQFVTHIDNNIVSVVSYMASECEGLAEDLKSVEEVLVVCHQIGEPQ